MKVADYDLDGFPDIVTVMKDRFIFIFFSFIGYISMCFSATNNMTSIILKNQECVADKATCKYNRTFTPKNEETIVLAITNATLAVFFDVLENVRFDLIRKCFFYIEFEQGYPDLLVLQGSTNQNFRLIGFQNSLMQDVHFIKVMGKFHRRIFSSSSIYLF